MKKFLCAITALLLLCGLTVGRAASIDEAKRLEIWNYYLNIERSKVCAAQNLYTYVYDTMNRDGELDYLSDRAYDCARRANELQLEIDRNKRLLSSNAAGNAEVQQAEEEETGSSYVLWPVILIAAFVAVFVVMLLLSKVTVNGMRFRDMRRALLKWRYLVPAVGLICGIAAVLLARPPEVVVDSVFPQVPDTDGEYIFVVETLLDYCDEISEIDGAIAPQAKDVKQYQLSSAMGEILNNRVAKDMDGVIAAYRDMEEQLRGEAENLSTGSWQAYNIAIKGPDEGYVDMIETYMEQSLEAQQCQIDADYCENIAYLMGLKGPVDSGAEAKTAEYIRSAAESLDKLTAPVIPNEPVVPYGAAAVLGFSLGMILMALTIVLAAALKLVLRRRAQHKQTAASPYVELMESINTRG